MFDNDVFTKGRQQSAEDGGVLFNNGSERNDVDDAAFAMNQGMAQSEIER